MEFSIGFAAITDCNDIIEIDPFRRSDMIRNAIENRNCYFAKLNGAAAGFAIVSSRFFDYAFIELLIVSARYRRQGAATQLLAYCVEHSETSKLFTSTNESNEAMRNLLAKAGFKYCGYVDALDESDPEQFYVKI
jgi:ribosomal protein S18 acetylase RimI-like enzyme